MSQKRGTVEARESAIHWEVIDTHALIESVGIRHHGLTAILLDWTTQRDE
jgi:hypothetical protein